MPSITAADVINKDMFAKTDIDLYSSALTKKGNLKAGALIGTVYSYLIDSRGDLYWMFYLTDQDFKNFNATYVKHDPAQLNLPSYNDLLTSVTAQLEADKLQSLGTVNYYIQKYAPYIVGGVVIALVLPSILNKQKKVGAVTQNDGLKLAGIVALAWYLTLKKRTGSIIIDPLTSSVTTNAENAINTTPNILPSVNSTVVSVGKQISYVGPFEVAYRPDTTINGYSNRYKKYII
jgi:branched-subunit amino acid transport protein